MDCKKTKKEAKGLRGITDNIYAPLTAKGDSMKKLSFFQAQARVKWKKHK